MKISQVIFIVCLKFIKEDLLNQPFRGLSEELRKSLNILLDFPVKTTSKEIMVNNRIYTD